MTNRETMPQRLFAFICYGRSRRDNFVEAETSEGAAKEALFVQSKRHECGEITEYVRKDVASQPAPHVVKADKPKLAEGATEGLTLGLMFQTPTMPHAKMEPHVFHGREQLDGWLSWNGHRKNNVVRILPDGAHEAAIEAARWEGAEAAFAAVLVAGGYLGSIRDLVLRARPYLKAIGK